MKKKILGAVSLMAIVAMAAFSININADTSDMSALTLSNVEALASGESGGDSGTFTCYSTYNNCWFWDCSTIYRCGNPCTTATADEWSDQGVCSK